MKCSICEQEIPAGQCAHLDEFTLRHTSYYSPHKKGRKENPIGISTQEKFVLDFTVSAWNSYLTLPDRSGNDDEEFKRAINQAQAVLACRISKRVNPKIWR